MPRKRAADSSLSIQEVMNRINESYPGALRLASDPYFEIKRVPTGILAFDRLTGGGIPIGRYTEIYGHYSVLKSYISSCIVAAFQKEFPDKRVMWVDSEGSFDSSWTERIGVELDRLDVIAKPKTGETMTEIIEIAMLSRGYCLFVVDSIAALIPQRETEYEASDDSKAVGAAGRMTSRMMRRLTRLNQNDCAFILINQVRDAIGVMFGDPSKPTGGRAIPFYAGKRIEFRRGETIKKDIVQNGPGGKQQKRTEVVARIINMRVEKDKTSANESSTGILMWRPKDGQIDEEESLLILGMDDGLVKRAAASITIFPGSKKNEVKISGWDNAKKELQKNKKLRRMLHRRIQENTENMNRSHVLVAE